MENQARSAADPIDELAALRQRVCKLEASEERLRRVEEMLQELDRLVAAFHEMGQVILSSLDLDEILDHLALEVIGAGIFRNLVIALVDDRQKGFTVVRDYGPDPHGGPVGDRSRDPGRTTKLGDTIAVDDPVDWGARAIRQKGLLVQAGWGFDLKVSAANPHDLPKVAYFMPVLGRGGRVQALLATASPQEERDTMVHRLEVMQPLLDQVAIALDHARAYADLRREVAERIQAERELREGRERYRMLAEHASDMITRHAADGTFLYVSRAAQQLLGYEPDELLGRAPYEMLHPEDVGIVREAHEAMFVEAGSRTFRFRGRRLDGTYVWLESAGRSLRDADTGTVTEIIVVSRDVTERRRAEQALQEAHDELERRVAERTSELRGSNEQLRSEIAERQQVAQALRRERDRFQQYLDVAGVMIVSVAPDRTIQLLNRKGCEILGCREEDAVGADWFESFVPVDQRPSVVAGFQKLMAGELSALEHLENEVVTTSGERRLIAWHNSLLRDARGAVVGTFSSGEDVTVRRRLEEQLRQAQKMQAVGQLTAGVAHNFNNMLMAILQSLEEAQLASEGDGPLLQEAQSLALRAAEMIDQLLIFSRRQTQAERRAVGMPVVMGRAIDICRRTFDRKIGIRYHGPPGPCTVAGDETQLEQVCLNLLLNARDALQEGDAHWPRIWITTRVVQRCAAELAARPHLSPGAYVHLEVTDNGAGMSEETRQRIFEPFYTTKEVGQGAGLGLATVYAIVEEHGGWAECASRSGVGTVFSVFLPATVGGGAGEERQETPVAPRGSETVLVIEDEERVRERLVALLGRSGYTVLAAGDGAEGVERFQQAVGPIHLVLLDLSLPRLSGQEVLAQLRRLDPELRVIVSTGYVGQTSDGLGVQAVLKKPYRMTRALQTVRQVLDW